MQIILQKDVKNLGSVGDVVSVKKGYARHFLFPKKWAIPFTKAKQAELLHRQKVIEAKKKKALKLRQKLIKEINTLTLHFIKEADSSGYLFGSVTAFAISQEFEKKGYEVDKKFIQLPAPLKKDGEHCVLLDLGDGIKTEIKILIEAHVPKKKKELSKD